MALLPKIVLNGLGVPYDAVSDDVPDLSSPVYNSIIVVDQGIGHDAWTVLRDYAQKYVDMRLAAWFQLGRFCKDLFSDISLHYVGTMSALSRFTPLRTLREARLSCMALATPSGSRETTTMAAATAYSTTPHSPGAWLTS